MLTSNPSSHQHPSMRSTLQLTSCLSNFLLCHGNTNTPRPLSPHTGHENIVLGNTYTERMKYLSCADIPTHKDKIPTPSWCSLHPGSQKVALWFLLFLTGPALDYSYLWPRRRRLRAPTSISHSEATGAGLYHTVSSATPHLKEISDLALGGP